ncbi:MAG: patatin-like phospholipase family protein [Pseudomonadota bacterium]
MSRSRADRSDKLRVAVACQGGGAQTAFTAGALETLLAERDADPGEPGYEIVALSGASGGAICAALAWFELLLAPGGAATPERLRNFWKTGYPNGLASPSLPEAIASDWAAFFRDGALPWRATWDSMRSEASDWALHQDFPGPAFPFQITARLRPYYFHQMFKALDASPGAHEARALLGVWRNTAATLSAAAPWPWNGPLGRMMDDAFELNPFLPGSALRNQFDALDSFREILERAFAEDCDALLRMRAAANSPCPVELLIGAADVNDVVRLDGSGPDRGADGLPDHTNFKVFRGSERLEQFTDVLLASAAIPELMRAVEIDGEHFWDGVFSQNPPILDLPDIHGWSDGEPGSSPGAEGSGDRSPQEIWLILINPMTRPEAPRELIDIDDRKTELGGNISLAQEVRAITKMNNVELRQSGAGGGARRRYREIKFRAIQMTADTKSALSVPSKVDRRRGNVDMLFDEGREQASLFLERWRAERRGGAAEVLQFDPSARNNAGKPSR